MISVFRMDMKEILEICQLNDEEMKIYLESTKHNDPKKDHYRAYRTMMNQTRRKLLKYIGNNVRTFEQLKTEFQEENEEQINYHLNMLEQLFYIMKTDSGWKATPRGLGFLYNAILEDNT